MQTIKLQPLNDFIVESTELKIFIIDGTLEYLGQELLNERWYIFKNLKGYFYTLIGASFKIEGKIEISFISKYSNLKYLLKLYYNLRKEKEFFYNIIICGKGRTSLTTTLINFFLREKIKVLLTELAPETGFLLFNGVLSTSLIDKVIEYNKSIELNNTLMYFYGDLDTEKHKNQYKIIVQSILENIKKNEKNIKDKIKEKCFNFIISTNKVEEIEFIKKNMKINEIIVIGDEKLFHALEGNKIFIPNFNYQKINKNKIRDYFYGKSEDLTPFNIFIKSFDCYGWSNEAIAPKSALPLGAERKQVVESIEDKESELNYVFAVMEEKGIAPCLGFVVKSEENRLLAPKNKLIKDPVFFKGEVKYFEG